MDCALLTASEATPNSNQSRRSDRTSYLKSIACLSCLGLLCNFNGRLRNQAPVRDTHLITCPIVNEFFFIMAHFKGGKNSPLPKFAPEEEHNLPLLDLSASPQVKMWILLPAAKLRRSMGHVCHLAKSFLPNKGTLKPRLHMYLRSLISNLRPDLTSEAVWRLWWPRRLPKGPTPCKQYAHG